MGVPSKEELDEALAEAARMREQGEDPHHLAKVLLNHDYRIHTLEKVLHAAELYLHSGQAPREHSQLVRAIEAAKYASSNSADKDPLRYGL
ncbi:MAG TPA: hypothetical protein ENI97_08670 [Gammaproteobacteria bacterium]|nr:hypothetical protein [Gammaproteobacteria bacterium]